MSFVNSIIFEGFANTDSSESLKNQFDKYCDWCWDTDMETVIDVKLVFISYTYHYEYQRNKKNWVYKLLESWRYKR